MEVKEQWIPIITEAVKWVSKEIKPSKKELQLRISDLEEEVKRLSYGNYALFNNIDQIVSIIVSQLKSEQKYIINADKIIYIDGKNEQINIEKDDKKDNFEDENCISSIFDGMDEEIKQCRLLRPSERDNIK